MKRSLFPIKIILAFLLWIIFESIGTAGAAVPERYTIVVRYSAQQAVIPPQLKAEKKIRNTSMTVAEFTDARQVDDQPKIGHVREIGDVKVPVYCKQIAITRAVSDGVKAYLKKAGYRVADKIVQWNLKEGAVPKKSGKLIISGTINELEVTCWTGVFSNDYRIHMKMTMVLAEGAKGRIIYSTSVTVDDSKTDVSFSEGQLGNRASLALGRAIEKFFEGKTIAQKIKEGLAQ